MNNPKFRCWDKVKKVFADDGFHLIGETIIFGMAPFQRCSVEDLNNFEIQQWTRLKDKNGKDIYDGDILKSKDKAQYTVEWLDWCAGFYPFNERNDTYRTSDIDDGDLTIIGNIFENPELLS